MKRRTFLQGGLVASAAGMAVAAGLLAPRAVFAEWNKTAFEAKSVDDAVKAFGLEGAADSSDIKIKAPDIAENGAVVPVTISSTIAGVSSITILSDKNGTPAVGTFNLTEGTEAYVSTRIKMGKTGNVVALVKAGDKIHQAQKEVKVTIGGCGG